MSQQQKVITDDGATVELGSTVYVNFFNGMNQHPVKLVAVYCDHDGWPWMIECNSGGKTAQYRWAEVYSTASAAMRAHLMPELDASKKRIADLEAQLTLHIAKANGDYWVWQGKDDHLESLTCPILIEAKALRKLIK